MSNQTTLNTAREWQVSKSKNLVPCVNPLVKFLFFAIAVSRRLGWLIPSLVSLALGIHNVGWVTMVLVAWPWTGTAVFLRGCQCPRSVAKMTMEFVAWPQGWAWSSWLQLNDVALSQRLWSWEPCWHHIVESGCSWQPAFAAGGLPVDRCCSRCCSLRLADAEVFPWPMMPDWWGLVASTLPVPARPVPAVNWPLCENEQKDMLFCPVDSCHMKLWTVVVEFPWIDAVAVFPVCNGQHLAANSLLNPNMMDDWQPTAGGWCGLSDDGWWTQNS